MTKYTVAARRAGSRPEDRRLSPAWQGIGCIMIIGVPVVSYLLASFGLKTALDAGLPVPYQLLGPPVMPAILFQSGLAPVAGYLQTLDNLYAKLALTVLLIVILGGIISVVWAYVYQVIGPPRLGPLDMDTPDIKVKRYKR